MLKRFLPSVMQFCPADCEVVVADNGSTDNSRSVSLSMGARWVSFDQNYGFAEGYNRALQAVDATYTVLLNSDVWVNSDWLSPLLDYMDSHPMVAAAQPKVHKYLMDEQRPSPLFEHAGAAGGELDMLGYPFCRGRMFAHVAEDHGQYDNTPCSIFWATGCAMVVRTSLFHAVGGLDADFFAHMEEIDLCWRFLSRGYQVVCVPTTTVYHVGGGSLHYEHPRKTFLNFRNNLFLLYKNLPTSRLWWVMLLRWGLDYLAALQLLAGGKAANARAVLQARLAYHRMKSIMRPKRRDNLCHATIPYPSAISRRIILFDYYLLRKKQ